MTKSAPSVVSRRPMLIGTASTIVVFATIVLLVINAPGWPKVRRAFFSGAEFADAWPHVLSGFWLNVRIFLVAEVCVLAVGLAVAIVRSTPGPAWAPFRFLATAYTDVFRGVPTILLVALFGFGVPPALELDRPWNNPVVWGSVALILNYGAYVAEVFRSGIRSVHASQWSAARSLGLTHRQASRYVIVPQAVRRVVPPLLNDFVALQKDSALVAFLGPIEALRQAQIATTKNFNYTPYLAASVLFLALTIPLARITDWLVQRQEAKRQ